MNHFQQWLCMRRMHNHYWCFTIDSLNRNPNTFRLESKYLYRLLSNNDNIIISQIALIEFEMVTWVGHLRWSVNSCDWSEIDHQVCDRELYWRWLPLLCLRLLCTWQMIVIFSRVHLANERRPVAFTSILVASSSFPLFPYSLSSVIPLNPLELFSLWYNLLIVG